jgi:plasmid maintenance system antidote protein VapI/mRNA-degrading endonuclease RelE of RelBE toxin-antitoxin system
VKCCDVRISEAVQKSLRRFPEHIVRKLQQWVDDVEESGIEEVRKRPGWHDEPLKGQRSGQRSIRLSGRIARSMQSQLSASSLCKSRRFLNMPTKKMRNNGRSSATRFLDSLVGKLTFGKLLESARLSDELTMAQFAKKLGISVSHLNDIEKGRKTVSPERAARFARRLGYSEMQYVRLALQDLMRESGLKFTVDLKAA